MPTTLSTGDQTVNDLPGEFLFGTTRAGHVAGAHGTVDGDESGNAITTEVPTGHFPRVIDDPSPITFCDHPHILGRLRGRCRQLRPRFGHSL